MPLTYCRFSQIRFIWIQYIADIKQTKHMKIAKTTVTSDVWVPNTLCCTNNNNCALCLCSPCSWWALWSWPWACGWGSTQRWSRCSMKMEPQTPSSLVSSLVEQSNSAGPLNVAYMYVLLWVHWPVFWASECTVHLCVVVGALVFIHQPLLGRNLFLNPSDAVSKMLHSLMFS